VLGGFLVPPQLTLDQEQPWPLGGGLLGCKTKGSDSPTGSEAEEQFVLFGGVSAVDRDVTLEGRAKGLVARLCEGVLGR
jgi:outer membrane lipoprotein SlyB